MYKRIHVHRLFPTSTTTVEPGSRSGHVLHPTQRRVITLREYARSQGFPDTFTFHKTQKAGVEVVSCHQALDNHQLTVSEAIQTDW